MFYSFTIIIASIIVCIVNYLFNFSAFGFNLKSVVLCITVSVFGAIVIDSLFAFLIRWCLPKKWFSSDKRFFSATKKESVFYEKIGVKKWKDKVIDLGAVTGFRKNRIAEPKSNAFIGRYIVEANYGVAVHIACIIFGNLVCLIYPEKWYSVGLPVGFVNALLNGLALITLRYNLPKLHALYRINLKREILAKARENAESVEKKISA